MVCHTRRVTLSPRYAALLPNTEAGLKKSLARAPQNNLS